MRKTILLSALAVSLFINSASARSVIDEAADGLSTVFHKTTLAVGKAIDSALDTFAEFLGMQPVKPTTVVKPSVSVAQMYHDAKIDGLPQPEEELNLVLAGMYPELNRAAVPLPADKLKNAGSSVLKVLKKEDARQDFIGGEYAEIAAKVSQNGSPVPYISGTGETKSIVLDWGSVTYNTDPDAEMGALLAKMASTHTQNRFSSLLIKAGN